MTNNFIGEKWKKVEFDFEYTSVNRVEVSNFGRIRTFNRLSDGEILKGSMINGYRIIRLKFFNDRDESTEAKLVYLQNQIQKFAKKIKKMEANKESKQAINEAKGLLKGLKENLKKKFAKDWTNRAINYHALVHRLVAAYFLKQAKPDQTIVAHMDYNKLNNHVSNLKWMTQAENIKHQQGSPYVIAEKADRKNNPLRKAANAKLTVTKVMLMKKLLNEGKHVKALVKQFKVSDMQVYRIKNGENWGEVPAAK